MVFDEESWTNEKLDFLLKLRGEKKVGIKIVEYSL